MDRMEFNSRINGSCNDCLLIKIKSTQNCLIEKWDEICCICLNWLLFKLCVERLVLQAGIDLPRGYRRNCPKTYSPFKTREICVDIQWVTSILVPLKKQGISRTVPTEKPSSITSQYTWKNWRPDGQLSRLETLKLCGW